MSLSVSVQPLQVLQQVEEGVTVGVRTRVERREQGDQSGVCVLDVYQRRDSGIQRGSAQTEAVLKVNKPNIPNILARS